MSESAAAPATERDALFRAIDTFRLYCGMVLLSFAQRGQGLRDTIARKFVVRGMTYTQSIFSVWDAGSEQDAWILHRSSSQRSGSLRILRDVLIESLERI